MCFGHLMDLLRGVKGCSRVSFIWGTFSTDVCYLCRVSSEMLGSEERTKDQMDSDDRFFSFFGFFPSFLFFPF